MKRNQEALQQQKSSSSSETLDPLINDEDQEPSLKVQKTENIISFVNLDITNILQILSFYIFPFNRLTFELFKTHNDKIFINMLFGYFKKDSERKIYKLYHSFSMKHSYQHYWVYVQYKQSINPFLNSIYLNFSWNKQFSDNLLENILNNKCLNLNYLNLSETLITNLGFNNNCKKLPQLNELIINNSEIKEIEEILQTVENLQNLKKFIFICKQTENNNLNEEEEEKKNVFISESMLDIKNLNDKLSEVFIDGNFNLNFSSLCKHFKQLEMIRLQNGSLSKNIHLCNTIKILEFNNVIFEKKFTFEKLFKCNLTELVFENCDLKEKDLEMILENEAIRNLKTFSISFNQSNLNGKFIKILENLKNLEILDISGNTTISGNNLEYICNLSSLKQLYLNDLNLKDSKIKLFLKSVEKLNNLNILDLENNEITIVSLELLVEKAKQLTSLDLSGNGGLDDLSVLLKLKNLRNLTLDSMDQELISNLLTLYSKESELCLIEELSLEECELNGKELFDFLQNVNDLKRLKLSRNAINDDGSKSIFGSLSIKKQTNLQELDLSHNSISINGIDNLKEFTEYFTGRLNLSHNEIAQDKDENEKLLELTSMTYDLILDNALSSLGTLSDEEDDDYVESGEENESDFEIVED
ncbi:hypothetical protein ABK040_009782 [Willaertia magna]